MFHGHFGSIAWSQQQQEQYYQQRNGQRQKRTFTGGQWLVSVIMYVWEKWYTLWKHRNQEVHGQDTQSKAEALQRDLQRKFSISIYQQRAEYEPRLQELLYDNDDAHRRNHTPAVIQKN